MRRALLRALSSDDAPEHEPRPTRVDSLRCFANVGWYIEAHGLGELRFRRSRERGQ